MNYEINFMELVDNSVKGAKGSSVNRHDFAGTNSGQYDLDDIRTITGTTTHPHEFLHLLNYFRTGVMDGEKMNNDHASENETYFLMWYPVGGELIESLKSKGVNTDRNPALYMNRRMNPKEYLRLNGGKGIGTGMSESKSNIGKPPENKLTPRSERI